MQKLWRPSWMESPWEWQDTHNPAVAEADEEIHKQVWETVVLARAAHAHVTYMWLTGWLPNMGIQYLRLWLNGTLTGKYRIWNTCWEMMQTLRREKLSFKSGKSWCSTKKPSPIATHQLANWKKFCHSWSPQLIELLPWMDVTEILDTRVSSKLCTYYMTGSGGLDWPCRCWRPLAAANDASNTKAKPIIVTAPLELLHVDFTSIEMTMHLDQPPNMVNILVFCLSTYQNGDCEQLQEAFKEVQVQSMWEAETEVVLW